MVGPQWSAVGFAGGGAGAWPSASVITVSQWPCILGSVQGTKCGCSCPQQQPKNGWHQGSSSSKTSTIQSKVLYPGFPSRAAALFLGIEIGSLFGSPSDPHVPFCHQISFLGSECRFFPALECGLSTKQFSGLHEVGMTP